MLRPMPNLHTILPGQPLAAIAARHVLAQCGEGLAEAVLLLPTRRACQLMRQALLGALEGRTVLLPRILPLGDLEAELPGLLPASYLEQLAALPPAMPEWRRLGLLIRQVMAFEQRRQGSISFTHALGLAQDLADLQDQCARAGVALTMENLRALEIPAQYASHWESSLQFLAIVAQAWPDIEAEEGTILASARQVQLLGLQAEAWEQQPPSMPVFAIGSTASQPVTARLLKAVSASSSGSLLLPGLDPRISAERWAGIEAGHPLYHLKTLIDGLGIAPTDIPVLGDLPDESIWLPALGSTAEVAQWRTQPAPSATHIALLPAAHGEEEARLLSLLIREGLEQGKRTALITPDEGLMQRVAAHLARYGIAPDRLKQGTLASTETGSLWLAMLRYLAQPTRVLPLLALLRHPLLLPRWESWLAQAEPAFRGLVQHAPGQLPRLAPELRDTEPHADAAALVRHLHALARREFTVSQWLEHLGALAGGSGEGAEAVAEALDALQHAEALGPIDLDAITALITETLNTDWRGGIHLGHPDITMLTPVEARLEQFDRILLANMQDMLWPGLARPSAWINRAQQQALSLPSAEENASLMAHDLLMLGTGTELFLSWPERDQGSPTTRSRFIERLVAYLAVHGVSESSLHAARYQPWTQALYEAASYQPAEAPRPMPVAARRPASIAASALDHLASDPYTLYARYVLNLKPLDPLDAEPEAREFGTLVHAALAELTAHWNEHARPATAAEIEQMQAHALAPFAARAEARLFWQRRLSHALAFVNTLEASRRQQNPTVSAERDIRHRLELGDAELTLHGRIDRLEQGPDGLRIGDYKTGEAPDEKAVRNGNAMQLLAYALLLEIEGQPIAGLDYWQLPAGKREGAINPIEGSALREDDLLAQLHEMLSVFMDPATPLLARPTGHSERYENPYDGISRYDEWAG